MGETRVELSRNHSIEFESYLRNETGLLKGGNQEMKKLALGIAFESDNFK